MLDIFLDSITAPVRDLKSTPPQPSEPMTPLATTIEALTKRITDRRPLRAGGLVVTLFGDLVMPRGGLIATQSILDIAGLLGLGQGLVRTTLSRLTADGMFIRSRSGRNSFYRLSDGALREYQDASRVIYATSDPAWDGDWMVAVPLPGPAGTGGDERLGATLDSLGFSRLGGARLRPANLDPAARDTLDAALDDWPALLVEGPGNGIAPGLKAMVGQAWDLEALAEGYDQFCRRYQPVAEALREDIPLTEAEALTLRLLLIHEFRTLVLRDPRLPVEILRSGWRGDLARALCKEIHARVRDPSERWVDAHCLGADGPLPPPDRLTFRRFG
jgi:phenylacetic acid degradation operon negative regulatory protein